MTHFALFEQSHDAYTTFLEPNNIILFTTNIAQLISHLAYLRAVVQKTVSMNTLKEMDLHH